MIILPVFVKYTNHTNLKNHGHTQNLQLFTNRFRPAPAEAIGTRFPAQ
jgi:hypothetical protein